MKNLLKKLKGLGKSRRDKSINLVERATLYMDFKWLDSWLSEVSDMNHCKIGQPFFYPESLIKFLALLYAKGFSYRELEGILHSLSRRLGSFPVICYSQIRRRIRHLKLDFAHLHKDVLVGIDGSGMKVSNRGEWIRQKWKVRRGWVKIVIMGTQEGDIVDVKVGNESLNEKTKARTLIRTYKPKTVLLDALHDANETFDLCEDLNVNIFCPVRKNSSKKGLNARAKTVREQLVLGRKAWVAKHDFGMRWPASEGIFSAVKRIFGEELNSHKTRNLYYEAKLKFWAYQQLRFASA